MRRHKLRMEIVSSEWKDAGVEVATSTGGTPSRILVPFSEGGRDLLRKALALVEAGLEKLEAAK